MEQVAVGSDDELEEHTWLGQHHFTYLVVILAGEKLPEDVWFDGSIEQVIETFLILILSIRGGGLKLDQLDGDVDKHYEIVLAVIGDEILNLYLEVHCEIIELGTLINGDADN